MSTDTDPLVVMVPVSDLTPDKKNPRTMSTQEFESLQRSLDSFGMVEPLVVNKRNMVIVGGHQRFEAAKVLKIPKVPVVFVDLDEAHQHALNIALNRISGEWDKDVLAELILELDEDLLSLTGFDDKELEALSGDPFDDEGEPKADAPKERKYSLEELRTLAKSIYPNAADTILDFLEVVGRASGTN